MKLFRHYEFTHFSLPIKAVLLLKIKLYTGDINIVPLKSSDDTTRPYLNLLSDYGYFSTINEPTREQEGSTSCIDHLNEKQIV